MHAYVFLHQLVEGVVRVHGEQGHSMHCLLLHGYQAEMIHEAVMMDGKIGRKEG